MTTYSYIGMIMKRLRETVEERALAQQIRRKMIQRDHGAEKTRYRRDKGWMRNELDWRVRQLGTRRFYKRTRPL
jgi:hypothetical protein